MKRIAPLFLLPLLLAACGQPTTPSAGVPSLSAGLGHAAPVVLDFVARFEAGVERDLAALGMGGGVTAQAAAPKSYLNVLRVNDSSARAYLKTTFPTATGCTLDWGDSSTQSISTPSTLATDKQDHTYAQSGTYTITLTCGTAVKTSSFQATVASAEMGLFDGYMGEFFLGNFNGSTYEVSVLSNLYVEKGLTFLTNDTLFMIKNGVAVPEGHTALQLTCATGTDTSDTSFSATSNRTFNIMSMTAGSTAFVLDNPVTVTGYGINNNVIGQTIFSNNTLNGTPLEKRVLNWSDVQRVAITCDPNGVGATYLNLDDMAFSINPIR